ncbi:MAG TPA: hypothetical protein VFM25_02215 [Verrucomicrobiae bacterium]|nr:hypothetical protein [Verrucomicrobiae bacterium]
MHPNLSDNAATGDIEIKLDGMSVEVPSDRRSFGAIRSYLELLALQEQRVLCSINLDGEPVNLTQPQNSAQPFALFEAETMGLNEVPAQLIKAALQQTISARGRLESAVELVLINDNSHAREIWWNLSALMKEPLLTLSLLPENICKPSNGGASLTQLRKWQLEQLGCVIHDVDTACDAEDTIVLSDALENRALPWLNALHDSLNLWNETLLAETRVAAALT